MPRLGLLVLCLSMFCSTADAATRRFAIIVGNNHPIEGSDYKPLQYADDDALRFAEFMIRMGAEVEVFTGPDDESARRFGPLAEITKRPRRKDVMRAFQRLEAKLLEAEGDTREVYVYFSGHGSVTSSSAFLHLLDGVFSRSDMRTAVLDRLEAERLHVIVDSCHAYFMVNQRGEKIPVVVDDGGLDRYSRTGFILSTSSKKEVQEWSGYQAGVFSYQLLGAMQGAADVDLDGRVTYAEAHAYVVAANSKVENAEARVQPFVRRPAASQAVLIDLGSSTSTNTLVLDELIEGHVFIVDADGRRVLDMNKPAGQRLELHIPLSRQLEVWVEGSPFGVVEPRAPYVVRRYERDVQPPEVASRGAVADEFRKNLFQRALTEDFVAGLDAATAQRQPTTIIARRPSSWHPVSVGLLITGTAGLVAGGVSAGLFVDARNDANPDVFTPANADVVAAARRRADTTQALMIGGFISGALMITAGLLYEFAFDEPLGLAVVKADADVYGVRGVW